MTDPTRSSTASATDIGKALRLVLGFVVVLTICWVSPVRGWVLDRFNSVTNHVSKNISNSITNSIEQHPTTTTPVNGG